VGAPVSRQVGDEDAAASGNRVREFADVPQPPGMMPLIALTMLLRMLIIADMTELKRLVMLLAAPGVLNTHKTSRIANAHHTTVFRLAGIATSSLGNVTRDP
jgi:hypothetical protein